MESGARVVVGVNRFQVEEAPPQVFQPDRAAREEVLDDLDRVRSTRDPSRVAAALDLLRGAARGRGSLMEPILAAVECYATIGEVSEVLEQCFGSYHPPEGL